MVELFPSDNVFISEYNKDDDVREGRGIYIWKNGNRYDGFFKNDKQHGFGRKISKVVYEHKDKLQVIEERSIECTVER